MADFQIWVSHNSPINLAVNESFFTWCNNHAGQQPVKRRLDIFFCNYNLLCATVAVSASTLPKARSDHYHILLVINLNSQRFASHFRFQNIRTLHDVCKVIIVQAWSSVVIGCPMFVLSKKKLHILKGKLKLWIRNVFRDIHNLVKEASNALKCIQDLTNVLGPNASLQSQELRVQLHLDHTLSKEDLFWHKKSRVNCHLNGDRNTPFFHLMEKIRSARRNISFL